MAAPARSVTSRDVARHAGVSRATVSYVLNGVETQRISAATRARVLDAAEELGYHPSAAALALRTGRSDIVVLSLPPWPHGPVVVEAIETATARLRQFGYTPLVHFDQPGAPSALVPACQRIQPVGLVAPGSELAPAAVRSIRANRTQGVVAIDVRPLRHVPTVVVVQAEIGRAAMLHLAARGHRRVLALMPDDPIAQPLGRGRAAGAAEIAGDRGVHLDVTECRIDAVDAALEGAMRGRRRPTAIYAFNDDVAFVAMRSLIDRGIRVPEEVAVIGADDVAAAALFRPALTTVRIDGRGFGETLATSLHGAITGDLRVRAIDFLHPVVIERESA